MNRIYPLSVDLRSFIKGIQPLVLFFLLPTITAYAQELKPKTNPYLWQESAYPICHWSPSQDDVSTIAMPKGTIRVAPKNVDFTTNSLVNYAIGHMRLADGKEVAWYGGPSSVGKLRLDGGRFDKLGDYKVPEGSAFHLGSGELKSLLADLDAAGRDEARLLKTFRPIFKKGYKVNALYYAL